ncbi:NADP-dependent oxidoreductase [Demequina iriomotensis]|uniref:NADP-dependent oxidoreductase n=1 Tax=Demequina iriomotensis TaxID=1536641 RepID=UPI000780478E|nr:NADP-dependent oxidoreductase [Demequina iriomotensis]
MKALRIHAYGGPEVLQVDDVPMPRPAPGEALVKVAATSFNPADVAIRTGAFAAVLPLSFPHTLGMDLAGTLVGDAGPGLLQGDPVVAFLPPNMAGAAAEYVAVPVALLAHAPATIPLIEAAGLPSTGTTAWQALFEHGDLVEGQRVLVNGGGTAVGGLAVQLAVAAGAEVDALAGPMSVERVRGYGAEKVVDYTVRGASEVEPGVYDLVVNLAPTPVAELAPLVRAGGRLVSATTASEAADDRITIVRMAAHPSRQVLEELVTAVDAGRLHLHVTGARPLEDAAAVHVDRARGKTLLQP